MGRSMTSRRCRRGKSRSAQNVQNARPTEKRSSTGTPSWRSAGDASSSRPHHGTEAMARREVASRGQQNLEMETPSHADEVARCSTVSSRACGARTELRGTARESRPRGCSDKQQHDQAGQKPDGARRLVPPGRGPCGGCRPLCQEREDRPNPHHGVKIIQVSRVLLVGNPFPPPHHASSSREPPRPRSCGQSQNVVLNAARSADAGRRVRPARRSNPPD